MVRHDGPVRLRPELLAVAVGAVRSWNRRGRRHAALDIHSGRQVSAFPPTDGVDDIRIGSVSGCVVGFFHSRGSCRTSWMARRFFGAWHPGTAFRTAGPAHRTRTDPRTTRFPRRAPAGSDTCGHSAVHRAASFGIPPAHRRLPGHLLELGLDVVVTNLPGPRAPLDAG